MLHVGLYSSQNQHPFALFAQVLVGPPGTSDACENGKRIVIPPPSPPPELAPPELLPEPLLLEPLPLELPPLEVLPPDPLPLELVLPPELPPLELVDGLPLSTTSLLPDEQPATTTIVAVHVEIHPAWSALSAPRFNRLSFALRCLGERM